MAPLDSTMVSVDPLVVSNPLKQEILRLNEENYYLKLEVIRLVSTLKSHQDIPEGNNKVNKRGKPLKSSRKRPFEPDSGNNDRNRNENANANGNENANENENKRFNDNLEINDDEINDQQHILQINNKSNDNINTYNNNNNNDNNNNNNTYNNDDELISTVSTTPSTLFSAAPSIEDVECFSLIDIPSPSRKQEDFKFDFQGAILTPTLGAPPLMSSISTSPSDFVFIDQNDVDSAFSAFVS